MKYMISFLIIILAFATAIGLYRTSPKTKKSLPERPIPLVETTSIHPGKKKVYVEAFGTVIPAKRITLLSEVEGRIIDQNADLIPGGIIIQDDMIVQVDPADYELRVNQYRAEMEEAVFELELEQGRQVIARREWNLLEDEIDTSVIGKSLALREPHLRLVKAKVDKAESRLAAAELELKRTTLRAPFNALIIEEFIDRGQLVSKQTPLATLAGTDQFWLQVSVPVSVLKRISFPKNSWHKGSAAQVIFEQGSGMAAVRTGHVLRLLGDLDPEGRMARLLVVIDDPLNLRSPVQVQSGIHGNHKKDMQRAEEGRILIGSYVKVRIDAGSFDGVYSIPRQALREGDVVWVQDNEDTFQTRPVRIVWREKDEVLVNTELKEGDSLILSRLQSPLPGMVVQTVDGKGIRE